MKAIIMSIRPQHACNIMNGDKTIELRKRFPKDYRGWVYCYCTKAIKGKPALIRSAFRHAYKLDTCYVDGYEINLSGKVACRFWVDNVEDTIVFNYDTQTRNLTELELSIKSCISIKDLNNNFVDSKAIHISKLEIFDKPKELGEFSVERYAEMPNGVYPCYEPLTKAPQSWQYVELEK